MTQEEFANRADALKGRLYRTALIYLGSEADALEAVDEAVYRGLKGCRKLREPAFFNTWLTRILLNVCAGERRRRRREVLVEQVPDTPGEDFDALPLQEAIARLRPELRAVIALRFFSGLTLAETARALDLPPGTVSTRQRRALELLRLELSDEEVSK